MIRPPLPAAAATLALACAALAAGCNTGFAPQYRVEDLRVLALRAHAAGSNAADVRPGDTLALEALVANPLARAGLAVEWYACLPAASEALLPCADTNLLADPDRLAGAPGVLFLGSGAAPIADPAPPSFVTSVAVPLVPTPELLDATQFAVSTAISDPAFRCKLYTELPVVAVARAGAMHQVALKRVRVWPTAAQLAAAAAATGDALFGADDLNLNPQILAAVRDPDDRDVCSGGIPVSPPPFPAGRRPICGVPDAPQTFRTCRNDGGAVGVEANTEDAAWQWYVTAGEFPEFDGIGNATGGDVDLERPPGAFMLWAILRDGRGGVTWQGYPIDAAP